MPTENASSPQHEPERAIQLERGALNHTDVRENKLALPQLAVNMACQNLCMPTLQPCRSEPELRRFLVFFLPLDPRHRTTPLQKRQYHNLKNLTSTAIDEDRSSEHSEPVQKMHRNTGRKIDLVSLFPMCGITPGPKAPGLHNMHFVFSHHEQNQDD
jgi:hypothetical protein